MGEDEDLLLEKLEKSNPPFGKKNLRIYHGISELKLEKKKLIKPFTGIGL